MDISKCSGLDCQDKETCYRYTCKAGEYQSYFGTPPGKDKNCKHYWKVIKKDKEMK